MHKSVVSIALILAAITFTAGEAWAVRVSPAAAKTFCKGKTATKDGGCAWCGKVTCTTVTCGKGQKDCDVITVKTRQ